MQEPSSAVNDLAHRVIGAAIEVHRVLGAGFLESVYEEALAVEMADRRIAFVRQAPISLDYKGHAVGNARLDFSVGGQLIIELKAVESFHPIQQAQVINYLRTTQLSLGPLLNFNVLKLNDGGIKRIVFTTST